MGFVRLDWCCLKQGVECNITCHKCLVWQKTFGSSGAGQSNRPIVRLSIHTHTHTMGRYWELKVELKSFQRCPSFHTHKDIRCRSDSCGAFEHGPQAIDAFVAIVKCIADSLS